MGVSERELYDPDTGVKRGLKSRHLSMMALAGIIGPGLLVGAGGALASGGPAALLIGFGVIGIIAFAIMQSLGELTTLYPTADSSFAGLGSRFVDPAFGAVLGWNYFVIWVAVLANEYNTVAGILTFWSDKVPLWGYFLLFWFFFLGFQLLGITAFGEAEFWLALIKLLGLIAFFFFSIIYAAGGVKGADAVGFRYWRDPGAFTSGFGGVATVFVFCSTFYAGVESVAVAATETQNPRTAIPAAIRQVFWRIIVVYMGSAFFFGLTVPANAPGLVNSNADDAFQSPMTIALRNAGFAAGVHLVNAFILITCISAVNSSIYIGSRTVLYMAQAEPVRFAPKILGWTDRRGVPIPAIIFTNLFGCLALMNVSTGAGKAYQYIVNLSGVSVFIVWGGVSLVHIRFRRAWTSQGRDIAELPYKALGYPFTGYFGLISNIVLSLIQGWSTFKPFLAGKFVDAYILLPLSGIVYLVFKIINRTHILRAHEIDISACERKDLDSTSTEDEEGQILMAPENSKKNALQTVVNVFTK